VVPFKCLQTEVSNQNYVHEGTGRILILWNVHFRILCLKKLKITALRIKISHSCQITVTFHFKGRVYIGGARNQSDGGNILRKEETVGEWRRLRN
jgi:hypothetical protein